jgi:hypothetical protein
MALQMSVYSVEVPLNILIKEDRNRILGNLGRFNVVSDLLEKTADQRNAFLQRCRGLFFQNLNNKEIRKNVRLGNISLDVSWLAVMYCFEKETFNSFNSKDPGFPLYEFTKIYVTDSRNNIQLSMIAGMFSTYMHDYYRNNIECARDNEKAGEKYNLASDLWRMLFEPNNLNKGIPLLEGKPVFIFPKSTSKKSETSVYMSSLGFCEKNYDINGTTVRCFHEDINKHLENSILKAAILSVGLVLVEITRPDLYKGSKYIGEFNYKKFTENTKIVQKNRVSEWLREAIT